jgi:hypothetical protein
VNQQLGCAFAGYRSDNPRSTRNANHPIYS